MLALATERKHHVSNIPQDLVRRRLIRRESLEAVSNGLSVPEHMFSELRDCATASFVQLREFSPHARNDIGVIVSPWLLRPRVAQGTAAHADRA